MSDSWDERIDEIEAKAQTVLERSGVESPPVPVQRIAEQEGAQVRPSKFGKEVSGLLTLEGKTPTIGYNRLHPAVRQRFTIAHELGHLVLRHGDHSQLFIDKKYSDVLYRDSRSSEGNRTRELEANAFAAALLMPLPMIQAEISRRDFDLAEEDSLGELAELFEVSRQSMAYRLANSGIFRSAPDHLE